MLTIWGRMNSTNVQKVIWVCEELGLTYDRIDVGGPFGGLDDPVYRAKNPNGLIPTIEDDGFVLWESHAILKYLAAGDPARRLLPSGRRQTAEVDKWMDWQMVTLGLSLRTLFMLMFGPAAGQSKPEDIVSASSRVASVLAIIDRHLKTSAYVGGEAFTIADIPVAISVHRWLNLPIERPSLASLEAWYANVCSRPAFRKIRAVPIP
jgi:glutathione S-transferase